MREQFLGRTLAECMADRRAVERQARAAGRARALLRGARSRAARAGAARRRNSRGARGAHDSVSASRRAAATTRCASRSARRSCMPFFEGRLFSATEVPRGKPAPDIFLFAAERMGAAPGAHGRHRGFRERRARGLRGRDDGVRLRRPHAGREARRSRREPHVRRTCASCRRCSPEPSAACGVLARAGSRGTARAADGAARSVAARACERRGEAAAAEHKIRHEGQEAPVDLGRCVHAREPTVSCDDRRLGAGRAANCGGVRSSTTKRCRRCGRAARSARRS